MLGNSYSQGDFPAHSAGISSGYPYLSLQIVFINMVLLGVNSRGQSASPPPPPPPPPPPLEKPPPSPLLLELLIDEIDEAAIEL